MLARRRPQLPLRGLGAQNRNLLLDEIRPQRKRLVLVHEVDREAIEDEPRGLVNVVALAIEAVALVGDKLTADARAQKRQRRIVELPADFYQAHDKPAFRLALVVY